jgi:hypothetical protein
MGRTWTVGRSADQGQLDRLTRPSLSATCSKLEREQNRLRIADFDQPRWQQGAGSVLSECGAITPAQARSFIREVECKVKRSPQFSGGGDVGSTIQSHGGALGAANQRPPDGGLSNLQLSRPRFLALHRVGLLA